MEQIEKTTLERIEELKNLIFEIASDYIDAQWENFETEMAKSGFDIYTMERQRLCKFYFLYLVDKYGIC